MKKYNVGFRVYGQSTVGRINYYQKMGVSSGIREMILMKMHSQKLDISNWKREYHVGNKSIKQLELTVVVPTPNATNIVCDYPSFVYNKRAGYIDMIHFDDSETQFHIMFLDHENDTFTNGYWHTVREGLNLEDTCLLFEYIEDRLDDLIILAPEDNGKYNATGALGVGI